MFSVRRVKGYLEKQEGSHGVEELGFGSTLSRSVTDNDHKKQMTHTHIENGMTKNGMGWMEELKREGGLGSEHPL